jgi:diguanylate cyclase (GGDEF)-like protein
VTPTIGPTGGITIGALATPTASAGTTAGAGAFALPLAPGLATATALSPGRLPAGTTPTATQVAADAGASQRPHPQSSSPVSVIERVVSVIPGFVWIALAVSLAFAAIAGGAAIWSGRQIRRQANAVAAISAAALTDSLTGVLNRRGFIDAVERELARAKRYGRQFVLAYVDVRGLKAVNDTEGHLAGDRLLRHAAQLLTESARADDVVGRIGGDEMGILLVEQGVEGASAVASRIASRVPECRVELGLHSPWDLTIGTATYPADGESVNELLATADRRLYEQRGIALS